MSKSSYSWIWLVLILLLMTAIIVPRLGWDGLWYDELFSVRNANGAQYAPPTLEGIWTQVTQYDPYQALGYPFVLAAWGQLLGWTEYATRLSSLLFALLAVALTYHLGKQVASAKVGLLAALVLAISTYFVNYAHELRAFTLVALLTAIFVWSYQCILTSKKRISVQLEVIFVVSGGALLWAHYYAAMLLLGLGLYHLLFAKKDRNWLRVVGLAMLIGLLFLPQLPAFVEGFTRYNPADVEKVPLSALEVILALTYFIGNNFALLTAITLLAGIVYAWREAAKLRPLIAITVLSGLVLLLSNELLAILEPPRLRYAVFLWPLLAVWIGAGLFYLGEQIRHRLLPFVADSYRPMLSRVLMLLLPLIWLFNGIQANYQADFNAAIAGDVVPRLRLMSNALSANGSSDDLLVFYNGTNRQAWYIQLGMEYATSGLPMPWIFVSTVFDEVESNRLWASDHIEQAQRIWYAVNRTISQNELHEQFLTLVGEQFTYCENFIDEWDLALDLYARSPAFCPTEAVLAEFGQWFTLRAYQEQIEAGILHLNLSWELADDTPPETYSLAVHLTPSGQSELATQADRGFHSERFVPMTLDVDISELPAGTYDVWLIVYNWQTGERLTIDSGADRLPLLSFTVE